MKKGDLVIINNKKAIIQNDSLALTEDGFHIKIENPVKVEVRLNIKTDLITLKKNESIFYEFQKYTHQDRNTLASEVRKNVASLKKIVKFKYEVKTNIFGCTVKRIN